MGRYSNPIRHTISTSTDNYVRQYEYDSQSRDFAMYLNGEFVGYETTPGRAEVALNKIVYDILRTPAAQPQPQSENIEADYTITDKESTMDQPSTREVLLDSIAALQRAADQRESAYNDQRRHDENLRIAESAARADIDKNPAYTSDVKRKLALEDWRLNEGADFVRRAQDFEDQLRRAKSNYDMVFETVKTYRALLRHETAMMEFRTAKESLPF